MPCSKEKVEHAIVCLHKLIKRNKDMQTKYYVCEILAECGNLQKINTTPTHEYLQASLTHFMIYGSYALNRDEQSTPVVKYKVPMYSSFCMAKYHIRQTCHTRNSLLWPSNLYFQLISVCQVSFPTIA